MPDPLYGLWPEDGAIPSDGQWTDQWADQVAGGVGLGLGDLREVTPIEGTIADQDHDYSTWFNSTVVSDLGVTPISPAPWPKSIDGDGFGEDKLPSCSDEATVKSEPKLDPISKSLVLELPSSTLSNPRSQYHGFVPPAPQKREWQAVEALLEVLTESGHEAEPDYIELELSQFTVYVNSSHYPSELRPLQHLCTRAASDTFYFDGVLSATNPITGTKMSFYVQRIPFQELPIEAYGEDDDTVQSIWIRSDHNKKRELYYKLGTPSSEYKRLYLPFLWIADLAHHVITYCADMRAKGRMAMLEDFQSRFKIFLCRRHKASEVFQSWAAAHHSDDFRTAVVTNKDFIWKEAVGTGDEQPGRPFHHFWKEIEGAFYHPNLPSMAQTLEEDGGSDAKVAKTIVTPYMYEVFKDMPFGDVLQQTSLTTATQDRQTAMVRGTSQYYIYGSDQSFEEHLLSKDVDVGELACSIRPGDVISTPPDGAETDTKWRIEKSHHPEQDHKWYGVVQKVHSSRGTRSFDVIWLYHPRDTPCGVMKYPFRNELFLSDLCNCEGSGKVEAKDVIAKHDINWFGTPGDPGLFVRQTYLADDKRWVTLKPEHLFCEHNKKRGKQPSLECYRPGDTVLADIRNDYLRAFVVDATFHQNKQQMVRLRQLLRRKEVDGTAPSCAQNELVYTDKFVEAKLDAVTRPCLIRIFRYNEQLDRLDEEITAPYDRNGTGDAFFITHKEVRNEQGEVCYIPLGDGDIPILRQGFHPDHATKLPKLSGLDLFCGGGNFGRGLEDGDGIEMKWANDLSPTAIHTYMANSKSGCTPYLGSVDDLLHAAITGAKGAPEPGDVHFISGGSPCQGFSVLTNNKSTPQQRKNQSLIASFASFIDLYRPYYGLLENVASIVQPESRKESCFFSQLVCAIVGLGYQVQILPLEAWSFGSAQKRIRLFLLFTAPGLRAPRPPCPSHSHPPGTQQRSFGKMSNGLPIGERYFGPTPFKFVSAREACRNLPGIYDGLADYCVGWPDHRIFGFTPNLREQLKLIPTQPWGMNFRQQFYDDDGRPIRDERMDIDRKVFDSKTGKSKLRTGLGSQGWGRVYPNHLFPTITTKCSLTDSKIGRINHWDECRPLSVMEVRRAQGFLDHEVVMGRPTTQWRIVGNSVDRHVALALGLAIREACVDPIGQRLPVEDDGMLPTPDEIELVPYEGMDLMEPATESSDEDKVFRDTPGGWLYELTPATSIDGNDDVGASHERGQKRANPFLFEFMSKKLRESADLG
ncbi:DNA methyltransferase Dim-2 [Apiospora marii]|uniref:DNA methyltransferase Dim-2 n=1 Tax=Apiospora marii TaxID=335849 RepID=UPI00312EC0AD